MTLPKRCCVEDCIIPHSHTTPGHKCELCEKYGHGRVECNNELSITYLPKRENGMWKYDIYDSIRMPIELQCTFGKCGYKWSHSTEYHHCSKCNGNHHSSDCLILNDVEWKLLNRDEYENVFNDLYHYNNVYVIFYNVQFMFKVIRKKDNKLNIMNLFINSWINNEHLYTFDKFIYGNQELLPNVLVSLSDYILPFSMVDSDIDEEYDEEYNENEIKCPVCRKINNRDNILEIKGSGDKCSVCYENQVEQYFPDCKHACVCKECYAQL